MIFIVKHDLPNNYQSKVINLILADKIPKYVLPKI